MNTQPQSAAVLDPEQAWQQLLRRDPAPSFFYAVVTTGVFCHPACPSRHPLRSNVRFFGSPQEAQSAGFRPCRRCKPEQLSEASQLDRIRTHLEANLDRPVPLAELARLTGMSPFTVQRMFKGAMGVSPLQYQRALRSNGLRTALKNGDSVTNAIYNAGFGSSSRAYEAAPLGMTPSRFAAGGRGERIGWAAGPSPFGWIVVGATARGLCWLALVGSEPEAEATVRTEFPAAEIHHDDTLSAWVEAAIAEVTGSCHMLSSGQLDLRGTAFQLRVWQALRSIPRGETRTYSQLARELGDPNATRAVARACATNRVALLVPCHRVIGVSGSLTGYRWGVERKQKLLQAEQPAH